ncbi:hypothetical protein [Leucobacter japonicus]|uniref:hypothetical protein n=1 Tax=Leucobacter japonicus TaxID=1461259 RepID=UPI000AE7287C|nr:hypothetical protein [Leucobacter japonicus]
MKSKEAIEARIAEARTNREFADSCVSVGHPPESLAYWEQRVRELSQEIWLLEWVVS